VDKKKVKEKSNDALETIYVATHPTRSNILTHLEFQKMYASKLEEKIAVDRKIISFHLAKLEKAGLVASEYGLMTSKTRPMAVRYYSLTSEGEKMIKKLKAILSD
jgi:predicted transcriptional regulator